MDRTFRDIPDRPHTALIWRRSPNFPVALGLTMAIKQYLAVALLMLPIVPLPPVMPRRRAAWIALVRGRQRPCRSSSGIPAGSWIPWCCCSSVSRSGGNR